MKIAMIGLGHIAKFQLDALEHLDSIKLVGAHDIRNERASLLPPSVPFYETLDEFLRNCKADLVLVSTPNITHYEIGKQILESGVSLLLEKPCCQSELEMFDLLNIAKQQGLFFAIAFHAAYARDVEWYLSQVQTGKNNYGTLSGFYCGFFDPYYDINTGTLKQSAQSLGGSWFDSGINALSVISKFIEPTDLKLVEGRMTSVPVVPSDETVYVHRNNQLIFSKSLKNGLPRLTNHYINLFQDIQRRFQKNQNNLDYAIQIHHLFFAAM